MSSVFIVVIVMLLVLIGTSLFSFYIGRKNKGADHWYVGGRSLPLYVVIGTQFATLMGGGVLVAHVGIGFTAGWSATTYGLISAIGIIPFAIMAKWLRNENFSTLPEVIKRLYGDNKLLSSLTILMTIVIPFGWLCSQLVAFGNLFSLITGVSPSVLIIIFAIISLAFVLPAGMTSVAWTDFIFGCGMAVIAVLTAVFALDLSGGWEQVKATIPTEMSSFPQGMGAIGTLTIVFWLFAILPGNLTNQQVYQRVFSANNAKNARIAILVSAILYLFALVWASIMGMTIRSMNPTLENPEMATGWFLTQVPTWFLTLFAAFIVTTIMSTVSSAVQSVVVNLTKDIYQSYMNPDINDNDLLKISRLTTVAILFVGVILAIFFKQALAWLVVTFSYSVSTLLVPIIVGFALKNTQLLNHQGAIGSMVMGIICAASAQIIGTSIPYVTFGIVGSLIGLFVFSFIFKSNRTSHAMEN
ncbi:sodium:solute symporter family protein [Aneurinibacillus sp. REN35]|uniref:sodium:solute symporter family protein n=1 Tax=Aneurinibacillus sp. REN35 TaxID=3237286 RepID=UPI00352936F3